MKKVILYLLAFLLSTIVIGQCDMEINASINALKCNGDCDGKIELFVNYGTSPYSYNWSTGENSFAIIGRCAGIYTVTITDAGVCDTILSYTISDPAPIFVNSSVTNSACKDSSASIDIDVTGGSGSYTFIWTHGPATASVSGLTSGDYTVDIFDTNNCNESVSVSVVSVPELKITYSKEDDICDLLGSLVFTVNGGTEPYSYYLDGSATAQLSYTELDAADFVFEVEDANNCFDSVHVAIYELECIDPIPEEAFSPNGDGINDAWHIQNIEQYPNCQITVYDRWGQIVFTKRGGYNPPWSGNNKLVDLPSGTYYYVIYKDENDESLGVITGSVALVR